MILFLLFSDTRLFFKYLKIFCLDWTIIIFSVSIGHGQIINKIDIRLLSANAQSLQNVIVVFAIQANVNAALNIKGKNAKATFVYNSLITHADTQQAVVKNLLNSKGVSYRSYYIVNMLSLKAKRSLIDSLALSPLVDRILLDGSVLTQVSPEINRNKNSLRTIEWNVSHIGAHEVWSQGFTGQNVVIGGQDTGYEWDDPALKSKYRGWDGVVADHNYNWHDAIHEDNPLSGGANFCGYNSVVPCDDHNHGTHTMGTMVGDDGFGNQIGVAPGAKWIGCRNMENGYGKPTTYLECFEWFLAPYPLNSSSSGGDPTKMPHVINNSWGCPPIEGCDTSLFKIMEIAVNNLRYAGCVVVVSAGNSGSQCGTVNDPAAIYDGSFSVGASNNTDQIASFSSRGPVTVDGSNRLKPNVTAPGVLVRSCIRGNNQYASYSGTSMAGPHVAGLVALLISANPELSGEVEKIEDIVEQTAIGISNISNCDNITGIPNNTFGYGRINALAAVNMALPTRYIPYVNMDKSIIIDNPAYGLVMVSDNNVKYRINVTNTGLINIHSLNSFQANSVVINQGSLSLATNNTNIIMKSPDTTYWKLNVNNSGVICFTQVLTLPTQYSKILSGDLTVEQKQKGLMLNGLDNNCYLTNIGNTGKLIIIPTHCTN